MVHDQSPECAGVPFTGEYLKRYEATLKMLRAVKDWRTAEFESGRPSSLTEYFRAHRSCPDCHGVGIARDESGMGYKAVGWDGNIQLFEKCTVCGGSGKLIPREQ